MQNFVTSAREKIGYTTQSQSPVIRGENIK